MTSKLICVLVAIVAAISYAQAQTVNVTCSFEWFGSSIYTCVIYDVTISDDDNQDIAFVGQHLEGRSNADVQLVQIWISNIPFVMSQVFSTFSHLEFLHLASNLTRIQPNAFANASSLLEFRTFGNPHLRTIQANAFSGATRTEFILIADSGVQTIDENAFNGLSQIFSLQLSRLKIRELPVHVFRPLESLTRIYLSSNQLESIPSRLFEANLQLIWVSLNFNRINAIERSFIDLTPALERLDLVENICADNAWSIHWSDVTLDTIREGLATCFDNFDATDLKSFTIELRGHLTIRDENGAEIISM